MRAHVQLVVWARSLVRIAAFSPSPRNFCARLQPTIVASLNEMEPLKNASGKAISVFFRPRLGSLLGTSAVFARSLP